MSLFTPYEERPPFCQAVLVWYDTVDEIAAYYASSGYEATVTRKRTGITLHLAHEMDAANERPGCDLTIELDLDHPNQARQMLIYDHPPRLMYENEFRAKYREAKELP